MKAKIFEGLKVKITSGDRDWVGMECTLKNVEDDGVCEVHSKIDYFRSNIKHIQMNPNEKWNANEYEMVLIKK